MTLRPLLLVPLAAAATAAIVLTRLDGPEEHPAVGQGSAGASSRTGLALDGVRRESPPREIGEGGRWKRPPRQPEPAVNTVVRTYPIPRAPAGWGYRIHVPKGWGRPLRVLGDSEDPVEKIKGSFLAETPPAEHSVSRRSIADALRHILQEAPVWQEGRVDAQTSRGRWPFIVPHDSEHVALDATRATHEEVARLLSRLRITPAWIGKELAGAEVVRLLASGSEDERALAAEALARGVPDLRPPADDWKSASDEDARLPRAPAVDLAPWRVRCSVCRFSVTGETTQDALTQLVSSQPLSWPEEKGLLPQRSASVARLLQVSEVGQVLRTLVAGASSYRVVDAEIAYGERRALEVGEGVTLRIRAETCTRDPRTEDVLGAHVTLRERRGSRFRFVPLPPRLEFYSRGVTLFQIGDALDSEPLTAPATYVLLTLEDIPAR